jgi:hypothetical protein
MILPSILTALALLAVTKSAIHAGDCVDVDNSGSIDIDDIVYLIDHLFAGGPEPDCGMETGTVTYVDGNTYLTIRVGDQ